MTADSAHSFPADTARKTAVIIGGGPAGTSCAIHLATHAPDIKIVLIDPQTSLKLCHALTHLSHTTLDTTVVETEAKSWCDQHNITFLHACATHLTSTHVYLSTGKPLRFDTCCLATGARPSIPHPLRNPDFVHHVFALRDTESVTQLKNRLGSCRRIIVVGAGGIGMETVYELDNCQVIWVVKDSHVGGTFFDDRVAHSLQFLPNNSSSHCIPNQYAPQNYAPAHSYQQDLTESVSAAAVGPNWLGARDGPILLSREGPFCEEENKRPKRLVCGSDNERHVHVYSSCQVLQLREDLTGEWRVLVDLTNGCTEGCDAIIAGTGVIPNTSWTQRVPETSTYNTKRSPVVLSNDDYGVSVTAAAMETSIPGVFAAGDCAHVIPIEGTDWVQLRTWGQALAGGRAAALAMAAKLGAEESVLGLEFEVFAHATQFFGRRVVLLGRWKAQGLSESFRILERRTDDSFVRVVLVSGRVRGAMLIGDVDNAEVFENLIAGQMDVSWLGESLLDEDADLENYFD